VGQVNLARGPNRVLPWILARCLLRPDRRDSDPCTLRSFGKGERHPACEASGSLDLYLNTSPPFRGRTAGTRLHRG
jgi:hypothetical protein